MTSREVFGGAWGKTSEGWTNPKSVTGAKQTRAVLGGARRREVAKTWGRTEGGEVAPPYTVALQCLER
jgi:hypothetical protein